LGGPKHLHQSTTIPPYILESLVMHASNKFDMSAIDSYFLVFGLVENVYILHFFLELGNEKL
jgi:hypothetical protein